MMKYTNRFEEMIDSRVQAIVNLQNVVGEQSKLLKYLSATEQSEKDFSKLITSLKEDIKNNQNSIDSLKTANEKTIQLINKIKKCDEKTSKLLEETIEELGIFENTEQGKSKQNKK